MVFKNKKINYETQNLLLSVAQQFINVTTAEIDNTINSTLKYISEFLNIDRCYIYLFNKKSDSILLSYQYNKADISEKINRHEQVDGEDFAWLINNLKKQQPVTINDINKIPGSANTFKLICNAEKCKSILLSSLIIKNSMTGFIGIDSVKRQRSWNNDEIYLLNYIGDIISSTLNRRKSVEFGKEKEQQLRTLFERSEEVVFISSPQGKFVEINPAGVKLFGYANAKEIMQIDIKKDLYVTPEDFDNYLAELNKNKILKDYEQRLKQKNGKEKTVLITAFQINDDSGNTIGYEGIIRDITEKRQVEQQLFQSQKMESIGMLAGGLAHDFNNILTAINGYAELVLMNLKENDPNYKRVKNIRKGGKQAENLVKQLLAFSRKQIIETKVCSINYIIKELDSIFRKVITEDIQLNVELKKGLNYIKADPVQIQQVLVNLIANAGFAIKQMKGISKDKLIAITTDEILADENFINDHPETKLGKYIRITVKDSGIGINKETLTKIFDPFFTTKKEGEGTGLGLSTVYGIIKQNDGVIFVNSSPGKGTSFDIYWPITKEKLSKESSTETQLEFKQRCETILFVEDDLNVRQLATDALISFGYEVYEAEHGKHALEIIKKNNLINKIDLMITDMVMPVMGGEELSEQINKLNPKIKIILSSGYTNSQIFKNETKNRNYFFLSKPYTIPKLEKKIRKVLLN